MSELRFDVYGQVIAIVGGGTAPGGWRPFVVGADGKRRPADFVVPDFVAEDELGQYLADLFHESATAARGEVVRIA